MAYGKLRFLLNNLIPNAEAITLSSQANGRISGTTKDGEGVATLTVSGDYTGTVNLLYTIEIDSVSGGVSVGQATFKWRTSATAAGTWEETGVLTRTTPAYALGSHGVSVGFTGGVGADFAVGDTWQFRTAATYGPGTLIDLNRMTAWQTTGDTSEYAVFDMGSAQNITAIIIQDHNLTSGATVKIEANKSDSWSSPSYSYTFATITETLWLYLDGTYQYWRILVEDPTNPDEYISIGGIYPGTYTELEQCNAWWGSAQVSGYALQSNTSEAGVMRRYAYAPQQQLTLDFGNAIIRNDIATLEGIQEALIDTETRRVSPLYVHVFSDEQERLKLMEWEDIATFGYTFASYLLQSGATTVLKEVVKI